MSSSINQYISNLGIKTLNEMQEAALDAAKDHTDIVLLSDTGSGKTLAFLLPVVQNLQPGGSTQAMIIVPSRELALQIETVFRGMKTGFKVVCCYGGHKREIEENSLVQAPELLIGTPGRLADHIRRSNLQLDSIETLVLDEFDKSLEQGFEAEMSFIAGSLKNLKKRILTSATESIEIPAFVRLKEPARLNFLSGEKAAALDLKVVHSDEKDKLETLFKLLCHLGNRSTIIFCNHRESVERVHSDLKEKGITCDFYHGALEQPDRDLALFKFRNGTTNFLVTTDLAARGLDIPHIRYIIHYHLPPTEDAFTHRNGRTARMEASGTAILILAPGEDIPDYITDEAAVIQLPEEIVLPEKPVWTTFYIGAGKKDKINKIDIVGFFTQKGELRKEDIGLIEVKDFIAYVAIRKASASRTLSLIKDQKIKGKKVKIDLATTSRKTQ
jgi:ATP-independent RNA helicase DbpA